MPRGDFKLFKRLYKLILQYIKLKGQTMDELKIKSIFITVWIIIIALTVVTCMPKFEIDIKRVDIDVSRGAMRAFCK